MKLNLYNGQPLKSSERWRTRLGLSGSKGVAPICRPPVLSPILSHKYALSKLARRETGERPFKTRICRAGETLTNERGDYVIPALPPATYRVTVSLPGFNTVVFQDVKIDADIPVTLNITIEVGAVSETVEVTAATEILQTNSATVSSTLVGRQINELPFVSRNVMELMVTQVGTQTVGTPRTSSINGLPKGSMNISMDGINIQDNLLRSDDGFFATIQPRTDSIEEVSVSTAGLGANNSGEGAAQVKFITKRGTNDFHGGLFWQHRNTALNANYYFNNRNGLPRDQLTRLT